MWKWFNCYLSGRHKYAVWCEPGAVCLRCVHCGRRSPGWAIAKATSVAVGAPARDSVQELTGATHKKVAPVRRKRPGR
jgi:hypothetical protein